jgi:hypothetical protein
LKRGRIAAVLAAAAWCPGHAGGIFVNSNQSAEYIRSFDRNSALDGADIAYYNMAGTARLPPGFTVNLSNQTILQRATVRPLGNPVLGGRTYRSGNPVWLVPNFHAVYRRQCWAWFTTLQTIGATAVRRWPNGLPSMDLAGKLAAGYGGAASGRIATDAYAAALAAGEAPAQAQAAAAAAGLDAASFPSRSWLKGSSYFLAWRLGAACRISPRFALALAGRLVWARQDVTGGVTGACTYDGLGNPAPVLIDVTSRAVGYSGEFGVNIYPAPELTLTLTCEMATPLRFRTTVREGKDGAGRLADGRRSRLDLPRTWRFGLGWQATPSLRASLGLNAYLEHSARMDLLDDPADGIDARRDYRNTYEQCAALECRLGPTWLVSLGVNVNQIGQRRSATLDTSLPGAHGNYLSLGAGARCQATDRLKFNFGVACTGFAHRYRNADAGDQRLQAAFAAGGAAISPDKEYDKRYLILAFGIEYHLPM